MQEITPTATKTTTAPKPQTVKRKIGKTTYELSLHFSQTSTERMSDKVMRLLENDLSAKWTVSQVTDKGKKRPPVVE